MLLGVPPAAWMLCWCALILALMLAAGRRSETSQALHAYTFVLSIAGLGAALALGRVLLSFRRAPPLCLVLAVIVAGIFALVSMLPTPSWKTLPRELGRDVRRLAGSILGISISLALVLGTAAAFVTLKRLHASPRVGSPFASVNEFVKWHVQQARVPLPHSGQQAPVVIVRFHDYECRPCKELYEAYRPVRLKYERQAPGLVSWVERDFPLDSECNASVSGAFHPWACEAAVAVRVARQKGREGEMQEWLFKNQATLSPEKVLEAAHLRKSDDLYARELANVRADVALGQRFGVAGTPTLFVDDVRLVGALPAATLDGFIARQLESLSSGRRPTSAKISRGCEGRASNGCEAFRVLSLLGTGARTRGAEGSRPARGLRGSR
jgi:hypothetical protein